MYIAGLFFISTLLSSLLPLRFHSQIIKRLEGSELSLEALDSRFKHLQKQANVHGPTISVVTKNSKLFQKAYGSRTLREDQPLEISENFYAASLSKPLFAFIVMKLVDFEVIDLDRSLVEYLDEPLPSYRFKETYEGY